MVFTELKGWTTKLDFQKQKNREIPVTSGLEVVDDIIGAMVPGAGPRKAQNRNLPGGETDLEYLQHKHREWGAAFFVWDCLMNSYEVAELSMQYFVIKSIVLVYDQSDFM